jgi:tRNA-specific 2-thiouridylase
MEKILVGLSGGVDSSTAAAILQQEGYDVIGAIMVMEGVSKKAVYNARQVASLLNIQFHVFDFTREFQKTVINNFINEYKIGRTPNPCILCNKYIKFDLFLEKAKAMSINRIATGHYACVGKKGNRFILKRGIDRNEQSYFLYRLNQQQLSNIIMPLCNYKKETVRKIAQKFDFPNVRGRKSQDICFITDGDYTAYLKKFLPIRPGPILNQNNKIIGEHKGLFYYTVGQRRNIGVSHHYPYYVTKIDAKNNAIYVGERNNVFTSRLIAGDLNFILFDRLDKELKVRAKPRYVSTLAEATIKPYEKNKVKLAFKEAQWALTPGQSVVFYQNDILLGGGVIEKVIK